jgi:Mrp family chromosome partitioning ATPase
MTWTNDEATRHDGGRSARGTRARWRRSLVTAAAGAVVLGVVGGVVAATLDRDVSASSLVLTSPDPSAVENPVDPGAVGDENARNSTYLETELVYLSGADLAGATATALGGGTPRLTAARVGDSNVVEITATAATAGAAREQAQSATDIYVEGRRQRLADRITTQLTALETQITQTTDELTDLDASVVQTTAQQQQSQTLRTRYADQLAVRDTLQRAQADVPRVASVVQNATVRAGAGLPPFVWGALLGALLGGLVGAAAPLVLRTADGRLRDEHDLDDLAVPVLVPAVPAAGESRRRGGGDVARAVQLQALQLPSGPTDGGSLAVLAGSSGVGASFVATQHAVHAARGGTTLLVCAAGIGPDAHELGVDDDGPGAASLTVGRDGRVSEDRLGEIVQDTGVPDLWVLGPGEAEEGPRVPDAVLVAVVAAASRLGWRVVVDTPPLDTSDTGVRVTRVCDRSVLVVAGGRTQVDEVGTTLEVLRSAGATPSAVLVNHLPRRASGKVRRG